MANPDEKIGPYTLVRKIGYGSFGVVWLAEKRTTIATTCFAIKLARDENVDLEAFKHEADIWVRASGHPNVLTMIEAEIYDGQIVIVSEYAPDGSLKDWLRQHGGKAPSIEAAVEMVLNILAGLEHLHDQRIIHRDIKPDNILLQRGTPRLADFGIARLLKTDSYSQAVKGTLLYMAPEAFNRKRNQQTDVWSVGVVLYQMISGYLPYDEPDLATLIAAIISREPASLPGSVPASLQHIVEGALQRDPSERYQSAAQMRQALLLFRREMWQPALPSRFESDAATEVVRPQQPSTSRPGTDSLLVADHRVTPSIDVPVIKSESAIAPQLAQAMNTEQPQPAPPMISTPTQDAPSAPPTVNMKALKESQRIKRKIALAGFGVVLILTLFIWGVLYWRTMAQPPAGTEGDQAKSSHTDISEAPQTPADPASTSTAENVAPSAEALQTPIENSHWVYKQTLAGHRSTVYAVAFSPDGTTLASGSYDNNIKLWDAQTGALKQTLTKNNYDVNAVAFSPDGTMLASGSDDKTIKLWDVQTGALKQTLEHRDCAISVAFSPSGKSLASGSNDKTVKLWDAQTGALKQTLTGHNNRVFAVAFSPDGKMLASGGVDKTIRLWQGEP